MGAATRERCSNALSGLADAVAQKFVLARHQDQHADACATEIMTTRNALSFHSVESFLEKLKITRVIGFFAGIINPFLLESILRGSITLIKHAEDAGER
jgi:hypothetical protein